MKQYLEMVDHVLTNGEQKFPTRRKYGTSNEWEPVDGGVKTIACANVHFSHEMSDGFPLLTTKKMAHKAMRVELEGFIRGFTSKSWYQERGCKIWNEWANPLAVQEIVDEQWSPTCVTKEENDADYLAFKKKVQAALLDLGPIYGYQWRKFGEVYDFEDDLDRLCNDDTGVTDGFDQLANITDTLRNNPMDRRMVCSAWNPNQIGQMGLPPCHWGWNVTVIGDKLNLFWVQRSCDLMLGVPFNIASYGLLLTLLAHHAWLTPGNLSAMFVDCHIYEDQIDIAKGQLKREPRPLPCLSPNNKSGMLRKRFSIYDWTYKDVKLVGYNPHPKIDFGAVVV